MAVSRAESQATSLVGVPDELSTNSMVRIRAIIVALLAVFCAYAYLRLKNKRKLENLLAEQFACKPVIPRVPYKWPFALDLVIRQIKIFFGDHTFEQLTEYFDIAGTGRIELFGVTGYFTSNPDNIETILSTRFEDYGLGSRRLASDPLLGEGIFNKLVRGLKEVSVNGIVDMKPFFFEYTLSTTTELLFGEPHDSLAREEREAVRSNFDEAAFGMGIRVRLADLAVLYNPPKFRKACKAVRDWASFFARKALKYKDEVGEERASEKNSFIIDLWKGMRDEQLVRDQLLHILVAGRDATATLISWTFFHLVRNPDILERLRQEVSSVPAGSDITRDQIQKLPFLRCCLNEILRLYPSLPMNIRFTNKATILPCGGGADGQSPVMLPKGAGIAWVFRPQRWESGDLIKTARPGAGYVDFNGGPRTCLGKDFALMEASYAVIRILHAFPDIGLAPGEPNEPVGAERHNYTISLSPTDGVKVSLG
ncbi:cytochrome P450 [Hypoxylon crocopeplum]|nr:cytochrome P450 [Hypoxylon crocopeplum]